MASDAQDFTDLKTAMVLLGAAVNQIRDDLHELRSVSSKLENDEITQLREDNKWMRRTVIGVLISVFLLIVGTVIAFLVKR